MARYKLTIAYDGTDFHGWQRQTLPREQVKPTDPVRLLGGNDPEFLKPVIEAAAGDEAGDAARAETSGDVVELRTVQAVVQRAAREVIREPVNVQGASRTDTGVHARGQVAAFTASDDRRGPSDDKLAQAMNSRLPDDVIVLRAERTAPDFQPISGATSKSYRYVIHTGRERPLWDRRYVTHVSVELEVERMREAAREIVGEHDFAAFTNAGHGRESTVRTVHSLEVSTERAAESAEAQRIVIDVAGNGFLLNMVRIIAGTLVEAGKGRLEAEQVKRALETGDRTLAGPTMPPGGLCLMWIRY